MEENLCLILIFAMLSFFIQGCTSKEEKGILLVRSLNEGSFDVFHFDEADMKFTTIEKGSFNKELELSVGSYIIASDCSSTKIVMLPHKRLEIKAHVLEFIPPEPLGKNDLFTLQCRKEYSFIATENFTNQFTFNMVSAPQGMLVGITPLEIQFQDSKSDKTQVSLSALSVEDHSDSQSNFFVSLKNTLQSMTLSQQTGQWLYLLPEQYNISINGTQTSVKLASAEKKNIPTGELLIKTPREVDLKKYEKIRGQPYEFLINKYYKIDLNRSIAVLPGKMIYSLDGAYHPRSLMIEENQKILINLKSVEAQMMCSPLDFSCLGKQEVSLFLPEEEYPYLVSKSDIPILYEDETVFISIEGSQGIRIQIPKQDHVVLPVSKLNIKPILQYNPSLYTDLVRVKGLGGQSFGYSRDILLEGSINLFLFSGHYQIERYSSLVEFEGERQQASFNIDLSKNKELDFSLVFYLTEKRYKEMQKQLSKQIQKSEFRLPLNIL